MYNRQSYLDEITPFIDAPLIKVITGMRRSGKSTIMKLLIHHLEKSGVSQDRILYINMESFENRAFSDSKILHSFIKKKKNEQSEKLYLFIDEVQEIVEWERVVNSFLADADADIFITGSNSTLLSGELATLIAGRYVTFQIFPLTFSEYTLFRESETDQNILFNEFLQYGGMPGIHTLHINKDNIYQYLTGVTDSIVLKDVVARNSIRNLNLLEKLTLFLADNIGNIFSGRKIAQYFKNQYRTLSIETIYNYIHYLETAFLINRVSRYDLKGKRLLETHEKYYLTDLGLRHILVGYREDDINAYLENIVYIELRKRGYSVTIGKFDDYEIDFIAKRASEQIYIQVSYLLANEKVRERETRVFYKIKDNYPKYLLTMDKIPRSDSDGIIQEYLPDWLL